MTTNNGKKQLCITNPDNFTDIRGIGGDPLYKRYNSVYAAVCNYIPEEYRGFLAEPVFDEENGTITWFANEWVEYPMLLGKLSGGTAEKYRGRLQEVKDAYINAIARLQDLTAREILQGACSYISEDFVFCHDGKVVLVAWGMAPNPSKPIEDWIIAAPEGSRPVYKVKFDAGAHGTLYDYTMRERTMQEGTILSGADIPSVIAAEGYKWLSWSPDPKGYEVKSDVTFTAVYEEPQEEPEEDTEEKEPEKIKVVFDAGPRGRIVKGAAELLKEPGSALAATEIPEIKADKGFKFTGWNVNPLATMLNEDCVFTAQYSKKTAWWRTWWGWLLWLLLLLLLAWLLSLLIPGFGLFKGCNREVVWERDPYSVFDEDTVLIKDPVSLPPYEDEDGNKIIDIVKDPDGVELVGARLLVIVEDGDLDDWARRFMRISDPGENDVIGVDRNSDMLVIKVPEAKRDSIRDNLPDRMKDDADFDGDFLVIDDYMMAPVDAPTGVQRVEGGSQSGPVWHLDSIRAPKAWNVTKGRRDVVVAIIDDGIDMNHPMLSGKITKPFNVVSGTPNVGVGGGHGTHVAGLAAGNDKFYDSNKVCGVSPNSAIMPIQVFQGNNCSMMAIVSGINYAIKNGADVVNLSLGPNYPWAMGNMPIPQQRKLAQTLQANLNPLYASLANRANQDNVILVWAVGNSNVLATLCPQNRFTDKMINVAAVGRNIRATDFTNYYEGCNISAPGKSILSSYPGNKFVFMDGTSMAAPIVTGAVALMRSVRPGLTAQEAQKIMFETGLETDKFVPRMLQLDLAVKMARDYGDEDTRDEVIDERRRRDTARPVAPDIDDRGRRTAPRVDTDVVIGDDVIRRRDGDYNRERDNEVGLPRIPGNRPVDPGRPIYNPRTPDEGVNPPARPDNDELDALIDQLNRLIDMRNKGTIDMEELDRQIEELKRRINAIRARQRYN